MCLIAIGIFLINLIITILYGYKNKGVFGKGLGITLALLYIIMIGAEVGF